MTRLPYRFANGGPTTPDGIPVVHAPRLALNPPWALMVVRSVDGHAVAYTADPDFEWAHYVAECRAQARRDDRICGSCHATNDTQLEQMLAEGA